MHAKEIYKREKVICIFDRKIHNITTKTKTYNNNNDDNEMIIIIIIIIIIMIK